MPRPGPGGTLPPSALRVLGAALLWILRGEWPKVGSGHWAAVRLAGPSCLQQPALSAPAGIPAAPSFRTSLFLMVPAPLHPQGPTAEVRLGRASSVSVPTS